MCVPFVLVCFQFHFLACCFAYDSALWKFRKCFILTVMRSLCIFEIFELYFKRHRTNSKRFLKLKMCAPVISEHSRYHNVWFYCRCWRFALDVSAILWVFMYCEWTAACVLCIQMWRENPITLWHVPRTYSVYGLILSWIFFIFEWITCWLAHLTNCCGSLALFIDGLTKIAIQNSTNCPIISPMLIHY